MAGKQGAAAAVNVDSIFKEVEALGARLTGGIDSLLKEKSEAKTAYEAKAEAIDEQVERLNELYHSATGRYYVAGRKAKSSGSGGGGKRRTRAELEQDAAGVAE